ncbi:DUF7504 family protein [Natronomonas sp. EA1]|uniref:DUF7504 family protein n=1 Tax=Natronomonas sp. EA1 TaxID=3421655 RepID=UPI003EBA272F
MVSTKHDEAVDTASTPTPPAGASSVLLLAPSLDSAGEETCGHLCSAAVPADLNLLSVTLTGGADDVLDRWRRTVDRDLPAEVGIITVGEATRSAAAVAADESMAASDVKITSVSNPSDLTGLGIKTSQCLSAWEDSDNETVVCFDSLTTLLQFAEVRRVFQFLHVLTKRIDSTGATAHFHMDPEAHDQQTKATLKSLFDVTYELAPDGEWRQI